MSRAPLHRPDAVVLGANGMLGHRVAWELAAQGADVRAVVRDAAASDAAALGAKLPAGAVLGGFDVRDVAGVERLLEDLAPRVVVNAAGVVKQSADAGDAELCVAVNALFPHALARIARRVGARVLHVSTDCVFSGARGSYREDDPPDAPDLYGRSKALGELREGDVVTVRTSIVGRQLRGSSSLLEWFLAQPGPVVPGYTRAFFSGVSTAELARVLASLAGPWSELRGVWHVAGPRIAKSDLLAIFRDAFGRRVEIGPDARLAIDRSLDGSRFAKTTGWQAPSWTRMAAELAAESVSYDCARNA